MKITAYNTKDACNNPQKMSLKDPFSGKILKDENGKTLDIFLYGKDSDRARQVSFEIERKFGKVENRTEEEQEQATIYKLARVTENWSDNIEDDEGQIKFSFENAQKLYSEQEWIALQAFRFVLDLSNFDPLT